MAVVFCEARATMPYLPDLPLVEETQPYFTDQLHAHSSLVAVEGRVIVGFAIYGSGSLHHLYVTKRRQGVGSALVEAVKKNSNEDLALWTFQENDGARRFYQRHGFAVVEETDGSENQERVPDVHYQWRR